MTTPVTGTGSSNQTQNTNTTDPTTSTNGDLGENDFLQLLVAQLKYQDPTQPADPSQFIAQTAEFTQVQDLTQLTSTVASLIKTDNTTTAAALLGRTVQFTDSTGVSRTGTVTSANVDSDGVHLGVGNYQTDLSDVTELAVTNSTTGPFTQSGSVPVS